MDAAEGHVFDQVRSEVSDRLEEHDRTPDNRYSRQVLSIPAILQDWNCSYSSMPDGPPRGAVVLLHGLTDSPYSLRHIGAATRARNSSDRVRLPDMGRCRRR